MRRTRPGLVLGLVLFACQALAGEQVYLEPETFLARSFPQGVPAAQVVWMTGELREQVRTLLDEPYQALRIRYWQQQQRSAWILDMIGKEKPITVGVLVNDGRIERLDVLVFRESRGWEVRDRAFTRQFEDATLAPDRQLSRHIDGITGATLSVRALKQMARLALFLHARTNADRADHARQ